MTRLLRLLLITLLLGLVLVPPLVAQADPLIPDRPTGLPAYGTNVPLYEDGRFTPYAYTFEGASQFNSIGHVPLYFRMNQLLVTKAWLLKLTIRIAEYALQVDFLAPFLDRAGAALTALGDLLWEGEGRLVSGALSLAGLWGLLLYLRGRTRHLWGALGGSVLIIMVTTLLLAQGSGWTKSAGAISRELSRQTFGAIDVLGRDTTRSWGLVPRTGDALWRTLVYEPWLSGEFGTDAGRTTYGQLNANSFLSMTTEERHVICGDRTRQRIYCPWWENEFLPQRMVLAGWTLGATVVVSGSILVLAGGVILAQLALLFLLIMAPVWLLIALWWPGHGRRLLFGLVMRGLGALVLQVVFTVTLGVLLLLSQTAMTAFSGWMLQSLVLTALAAIAFRYRTAWLEPVAAVRRWGLEQAAAPGQAREEARARRSERGGAGAGALPAEAIPAFAGLAGSAAQAGAPAVWVQQAEPREGAPRTEQAGPPAAASPISHFRGEMQHLRTELTTRERLTLREQVARSGEAPGEEGATMPTLVPPRRQAAAARERGSDMTRLSHQRPRE